MRAFASSSLAVVGPNQSPAARRFNYYCSPSSSSSFFISISASSSSGLGKEGRGSSKQEAKRASSSSSTISPLFSDRSGGGGCLAPTPLFDGGAKITNGQRSSA